MEKGTQLTIDAKPEPLIINATQTAVLVVDMQNDFAMPGGMFDRAGIDVTSIRAVVPPTKKLLETTRRAAIPTIYIKMGFRPDLSDAGAFDAPNMIKHTVFKVGTRVTAPNGSESRILIRDTWNTDVVDELRPRPEDIIVYKTRFSGFYATELDQILRQKNIRYLIVTGCTTSVCVESTVRDAMFRDYHCLVIADCTAETLGDKFPRTNHEASLLVIQTVFGCVTNSGAVVSALEQITRSSGMEAMITNR